MEYGMFDFPKRIILIETNKIQKKDIFLSKNLHILIIFSNFARFFAHLCVRKHMAER
jgi:hypothetical protein